MIDYYKLKKKSTIRKQTMKNVMQETEKSIAGVIKIDEKEVSAHLS